VVCTLFSLPELETITITRVHNHHGLGLSFHIYDISLGYFAAKSKPSNELDGTQRK
jgi:hypothetical protein